MKKFGLSAVEEGPGDVNIIWTFNAAGAQIIEKSTHFRCARFKPTAPPARGQNVLFNGYKTQGCGVTVFAYIRRVTQNSPLAHSLDVSLIDDSSFEAIRQASARFATQATRDTASKVGVTQVVNPVAIRERKEP